MKKNFKGSSLVEVMVIMIIVVSWVTWMYAIYWNSQKMSNNLDMKIQAIQIAREGIEAMTNIRDTNWKMLSTDNKNCWNTLNYDTNCVWNNTTTTDIKEASYIIYQDNTDYKWKLDEITLWNELRDYKTDTYRDDYKIFTTDSNGEWFYTQETTADTTKFTPFTREIIVTYFDSDKLWASYNPNIATDSNWEFMKITSKVMWVDSSREQPYSVEFETFLSNWKALN